MDPGSKKSVELRFKEIKTSSWAAKRSLKRSLHVKIHIHAETGLRRAAQGANHNRIRTARKAREDERPPGPLFTIAPPHCAHSMAFVMASPKTRNPIFLITLPTSHSDLLTPVAGRLDHISYDGHGPYRVLNSIDLDDHATA